MKITFKIILMIVGLGMIGCSVFGKNNNVDELKYTVLEKDRDFEIRQYDPYIAATTTVSGSFKESQGKAFRILADYIFGNNTSKSKIAMTAPVTQSVSEKIAMTAPVFQTPTDQGYTMSFSMPSSYTIETLPKPNNDKVTLVEIPAKKIAAHRYTGFWSQEKNDKKANELLEWLKTKTKYTTTSKPIFAGYNPPWTLPFFRRNEALLEIK